MSKKMMDIKEFREFGYLQEVNRLMLHPLGLALQVTVDDETGEETLSGVWDHRDDLEGIIFADLDHKSFEKAERVEKELNKRLSERERLFGNGKFIQPAGG